jgi:hypothetical protein
MRPEIAVVTKIVLTVLVTVGFSDKVFAQHHATRNLDLVNNAHAAVSGFFASTPGANHWDANLLEGHALRTNFFVQLDLDDPNSGCHYDFKTVFADGNSVIHRNVDVCTSQTYKLTDP